MSEKKPYFSVVIPFYRGASMFPELYKRLSAVFTQMEQTYELIFVNDASPDEGETILANYAAADENCKVISFSRNFGQHYAITAGLKIAKGEWIVVMDCDLQDRPEEIPHLFEKTKEGYDAVFAHRTERKDNLIKKFESAAFYFIFNMLSDIKMDRGFANFGIYHNKVIKAALQMGDKIKFFPIMIRWVGFKQTSITVQHDIRSEGKSSYTLRKLFILAFDNIISFSDKPLRYCIIIGTILFFISIAVFLLYATLYFQGKITVMGYTSLILSLWSITGVLLMTLGLHGCYLGKVFNQVKNRPIYIIDKTINVKPEDL